MKHTYIIQLLTILSFQWMACSKNVAERNEQYPSLNPARIDTAAGNWLPILLTSSAEFSVPPPVATNTPTYLAELNEIKSWQQNLTAQQQQMIRYWSAGAVLRWNEILRTLVAKRNLPPYQNPNGTYPFPSAANPFAYPIFPFANPPYAARAYAYVSAAQYDALIATFYYKQLYTRNAPYAIDANIKALVPRSTLYAYPSEDAAVVGVTVELLKLLFPADLDYIQQKADEHKRYRIMAGANVRSDIEAGEALGKAVAQKFTARARTDKAAAAIGTPLLWQQLEDQTIAAGFTPWISQESPKRPPMLPLFGKVKGFLADSATIISLRPPVPPATSSQTFKEELEEVRQFSHHATKDQIRIAQFWADGVGSYTPPGHWNAIAADEFVQQQYSEVRWARNMALLNMSMMDAAIACWDTKYTYFTPRPSQVDPSIKTVTGLPNFPSYTSGHSTFSGASATVLGYIIPAKANQFNNLAKEASVSRLYAAIHYRSDCDQGLICGQKIGTLAVNRALIDGADK
jgi:hypothetical protein